MSRYHDPVLLAECIEGLNINPNGTYVDVTFGGGGHSRSIVSKITNGHLYAFDQDQDALDNTLSDDKFTLINANFRYLKSSLRMYGVKKIDGLLADLGVSSHQFDIPDRGFSTRFEADLDMRMDQSAHLNAFKVLNEYTQEELRTILKFYGELKRPGTVARIICEGRLDSPISSVSELKRLLKGLIPSVLENKFYAQVFQAIRIEVNDELNALKEMLTQANDILVSGGTGAGKTTTLYSALREVNNMDTKLLTAEDPVEYEIEGIMQVPVNHQVGLDFSRALRAFLRQDPDKIMVGEIITICPHNNVKKELNI